ncbi:MAG: hypothetical protein PUG69_07785 [Ruminococcus sp.]|nr:hypothetical protein [Ruminococcus sp.]
MSEKQPKAVANDTVQTTTYRRDSPCNCRAENSEKLRVKSEKKQVLRTE